MDWWEWIKDRYGDTKDYVEGYPDAYFSNVKQGLLQSADLYKKTGGVGPGWSLPFAFSLNPFNVAADDAMTAASKPIADITGAKQQDVKNTLSAISMALPLLRSNKGLTLSGKTEVGTSLAKRPPLLEYKDKYPLSMWSDMPEWTATDVAQRGDAAPNPVDTFYYSRAVEKVRGLDTNTLYPLSDLVSWLPKSAVIDQSTGKKGAELSRYAKDAVKDELQYFGADQWAQDQIDQGREYFKPQELLDYLREQGEVRFRLRTSFVDVAGDLGFDISDEIEWTNQYGSGVTADDNYPEDSHRDWGTQTELGRGEYGYVNEGFIRGAPFTFPDVGPSEALRVRLYQDAPTTGDDIVESLLMDDYITEPLKEEWINTLGETRVVDSHGTTGAHPVSTRVEVDVFGTGSNEYNAGFLENLSGSFGFQRPEDHVIDGPTYTVALSAPPMRFDASAAFGTDDWYWIGSDPEANVSVNFDLTHLTNKAYIPWKDRAAVGDEGMSPRDERAVWGDLADVNRYSAGMTTGARLWLEPQVPTNETVFLQAIEQYLKSSSEGGALGTDIVEWYKEKGENPFVDTSLYSASSLVEIRDGLGYNSWSPAVLRNAVSDGRVRLIPATEEGLDELENRLLNYFGFVSETEFNRVQPLPADGVTHTGLGYVSEQSDPGVFDNYNHVREWAVQFREMSTGDPEWTTVKNVRHFTDAVRLLESMYAAGDSRNILSDIQPKEVTKVLDNINKVITPPEAEASARAKLMDIFAHVRADLTEPQQDEGRIQVMKNTGGLNPAEWESYYNFSPLTPFVEQRYRFIAQSAFKNAMQLVNPYGWKTEALIEAQDADVFDNTGEDPDWLHHVTKLFSGVGGDETAGEALSEFNRFWSRAANWEVEYGGYLSGEGYNDDRAVSTVTYDSLGDARNFANDQIRSELEEVYPQDVNNLGAGEFSPQWQGYGLSHGSWNASIQDGTEKYREVLITVGNDQGYQHDALHFNWDYATEEFGDEGADVRSAYFGTNRLPPMLGDYPIDSDDASMWRDEHALPTKFVPRRFVEGVEFSGRQYPPIYKQMGHWSTVGRDLPGEHNLVSSMMVTEATYNPVDRPLWKPTGDIKELLISELQGDVHQFGSAYGYGRTGENVLDIPAGDPDFPQLEGARQEDIDPLREPFTVESHRRTAEDLGELAYHQTLLRSGQVGRPYRLAPGTQEARLRNQPLLPRTNPSSWVGNAVIEAVRFALENNYDYVTWPVGEEVVRKWRGQGPEKKKFYDTYMPKTARQVLGVEVEVGPHANRNGIIMMRIPIGDPEVKKTLMEFFKTQGIPTFSQTEQPRQVAYA